MNSKTKVIISTISICLIFACGYFINPANKNIASEIANNTNNLASNQNSNYDNQVNNDDIKENEVPLFDDVESLNNQVSSEENKHEEDIKFDNKKINIYVFWGNGCPHCRHLFEFLSSLDDEYKSYFNLYPFETWYDTKNQQLLSSFGTYMNKTIEGVPFMVIGSESFVGFNDTMSDSIKETIKNEYNKKEHFDYYKKMKNLS